MYLICYGSTFRVYLPEGICLNHLRASKKMLGNFEIFMFLYFSRFSMIWNIFREFFITERNTTNVYRNWWRHEMRASAIVFVNKCIISWVTRAVARTSYTQVTFWYYTFQIHHDVGRDVIRLWRNATMRTFFSRHAVHYFAQYSAQNCATLRSIFPMVIFLIALNDLSSYRFHAVISVTLKNTYTVYYHNSTSIAKLSIYIYIYILLGCVSRSC